MEKERAQYMMIYKCKSCDQKSGWTEQDTPSCRYCDDQNNLTLIKKNEITPEIMADRLKAVTVNMMENLKLAYDRMPNTDLDNLSEDSSFDMEKEMLLLMEKAKQLRDSIQELELKENNEEE